MNILVTGGAGYIGSHTITELLASGHDVVVVDNLSNSSLDVLDGIERITGKKPIFEQIDLREKQKVDDFFKKYTDIDGVIHFAASKAVGESVEKPLLYYENNISSLVYLLQNLSKKQDVGFIFSSSCTVYGQADKLPISEDAPVKKAESPYGNTKQIDEEIIYDTCKVTPQIKAIALRYFNPIGAHPSAEIGELPIGVPQNLVPFITQTAIGIRECLSVFGKDYPTPDGTCIRDYIHVVDLAKGHLKALENNRKNVGVKIYNLGSGSGVSVLELVRAFEKASGKKIPFEITSRRAGDIAFCYADVAKAEKELGWKTEKTLEEMCRDSWNWQSKNPNGLI